MEADKVVFAEDTMTVHRVLGQPVMNGRQKLFNVESVTLTPGDTIPLEELPDYQKTPLLNEGIPGLSLLTAEEVETRLAERDRVLGLTATQSVAI